MKKSRPKGKQLRATVLDHRRVALNVLALVIGMFCLSYASVPLYSLFCKVTGFGGTPKTEITALPTQIINRTMNVRFNTDIDTNLGWVFKPEQSEVRVRIGEQRLIFFSAENISGTDKRGVSSYNVTPFEVGRYLNKIKCFCFEEQIIKAGEKITFPVSFFIDPEMVKDKKLDELRTITLSYTFFKVKGS